MAPDQSAGLALKTAIKRDRRLKRLALLAVRWGRTLPAALPGWAWFWRDWRRFRKAGGRASLLDTYPCLNDRTAATAIDPHYFHQAIWAFKRIQSAGPRAHVDVGALVDFVGMLTAIADVTFVDIRPVSVELERFTMLPGSALDLPFADGAVHSLSCLHVLEHIGLGRYGDEIAPDGAERACRELTRVLTPGGRLYLSTPIGRPRVCFNGLRVFAPGEPCALLAPLALREFSMVDARGELRESVHTDAEIREEDSGSDHALGLYVFEKEHAA